MHRIIIQLTGLSEAVVCPKTEEEKHNTYMLHIYMYMNICIFPRQKEKDFLIAST